MNVASLQEIKSEIQNLSAKELSEICIQLAKYKKDNKEYIGYLLFESQQRDTYIQQLKSEVDALFSEIEISKNYYYTKKSLRKILRIINKYGKYIADKSVSADLLLYFCMKIKESNIPLKKSLALEKIYTGQIKKINVLIKTLHEDLQADYLTELANITQLS